MSVREETTPYTPLCGAEGDLLCVRLTVEAFLLEDLLEALAVAPFPINPEIGHHATLETSRGIQPAVHVEFPVWGSQMEELGAVLDGLAFDVKRSVSSMIEEIRG